MPKAKFDRRIFIEDARKGKLVPIQFQAVVKYNLNEKERAYVLDKLPVIFHNYSYCLPKPAELVEIGKYEVFIEDAPTLIKELPYLIEEIRIYRNNILKFLSIYKRYEHALVSEEYETCIDMLDEMDEVAGCSYFTLMCEYYINEKRGDQSANEALLSYLNDNEVSVKMQIAADFIKFRIDKDFSSLQYSGTVEQHIRLYDEKINQRFIDYVHFKFDYFHYDSEITNYPFILAFDGDFSIIDRYLSLKRWVSSILADKNVNDADKKFVINSCINLFPTSPEPYWINFKAVYGTEKIVDIPDRSGFYQIQELFFQNRFTEVVNNCVETLNYHPEYSELYLPLVQSLLIIGKSVSQVLLWHRDVNETLTLMESILIKDKDYLNSREKLLKKFYTIAHFDYSTHILEFIYNEYHINISPKVQLISLLNSAVFRYNSFKVVKDTTRMLQLLSGFQGESDHYLVSLYDGKSPAITSYLGLKISVGFLIRYGQYQEAIDLLIENQIKTKIIRADFMKLWVDRNLVKCYAALNEYGKAADIIVAVYFEKKIVLELLAVPAIFEKLMNPFEISFSKDLSIPIMLELYHQPQSVIYDAIANYLVANNVYKPSELIGRQIKEDTQQFSYFLEKCCVMENIEYSPFFKTVDLLEEERIKILNYLKAIFPERVERYNKEILMISQRRSIRRGLLQIHESRIYVDETGILNQVETLFRETFTTYQTINIGSQHHPAGVKLHLDPIPEFGDVPYYFKTEVLANRLPLYHLTESPFEDSNAVVVPFIKYAYFQSMFISTRDFFVKDEDFGFKGFLSMRIRHGTFSNVIRTVFEKYHLVSSKEGHSNVYQDIAFWNNTFLNFVNIGGLQKFLHGFSAAVDGIIDEGLSWLAVNYETAHVEPAQFDFYFSDSEMFDIYRNRVGRITKYEEFMAELFNVLYERLEDCLNRLKPMVNQGLTDKFCDVLQRLDNDIAELNLPSTDKSLIHQEIISCRTEIQLVTSQIESWFQISKNKYIEQFPISLIKDTIVNYINQIYGDALKIAGLSIEINCEKDIKGRYFEAFGDLLINIFENVLSKNKDLDDSEKLINIKIGENQQNGQLIIEAINNVSFQKDETLLQQNIEEANQKIASYRNGTDISYERGSGFLKLCKNVHVDLDRGDDYLVVPSYENRQFKVTIEFNTKNLFA